MTKQGAKTAVPKLRFPEFRAQQPWKLKELSELLTEISNGVSLTQNSSGVGVKVTRIETIANGTIDLNRVGYVDAPAKDLEGYRLEIGDVLFSNINSIAHIGKSVLIDADHDLYHGMNLLRLKVDVESNSPRFVYFSINNQAVRKSIRERANKAVNQASINQTELGRSLIPSPTRSEQQRIADCLTSLDEVIAAQGRKVEALKTHKRGLMQQLFPREGETRPRLRFPEFRDAPEWEKKQLAELGEIITGKTPSTSNAGLWGGGILFITPTDIDDSGKYQDTSQRTVVATSALKVLPVGSIAYTCIASIGKLAITVRPSVTNQQINSVITRPSIDNEFVYYALVHLTPWIKSIPATSTLPIINKTEFSAIEIGIPSDSLEQKAVADCLSSLDTRITAETNQLAALKTHKQGLMQQLFPAPEAATA